MESRYWIGVVSRDHVMRGVAGGFAQVCHGKEQPLKRMHPGDWLIYYSPKTRMDKGEVVQAFTAIGRVADDKVYSYPMTDSFIPFRRNIIYETCREVPIHQLLDRLSFIKDKKRWGYPFRRGHFQITKDDFLIIANAMGVQLEETGGEAQ